MAETKCRCGAKVDMGNTCASCRASFISNKRKEYSARSKALFAQKSPEEKQRYKEDKDTRKYFKGEAKRFGLK